MLVAMTAMLVSVAEFSNILSVLAVLMCFCAMFLLIMRNMTVFWLHGEELMFGGNAVHPVQQRIPQMKMMKVHIPFTFKLHETSNSSYSDLRCTISSQVPYTLQAFWGVSIRELHHFLWKAWSSFQTAVKDDSLLRGHYQHCGLTLHETSHTEKTIQMFMPEGKLDLGTPPRHCYPLVIFLIRDTPENSTLHPDETVALVNVVHIRDNVCTLPTNILAQYLKQANGQLSSLKDTDFQKYLNTVGYSEFEVSKRKPVEKLCPTEGQKCSRKIMRPAQNQKDFGLCVTLIKMIMESQLIFKEDTSFIKEFIPSEHFKYPPFLTKQKSITLLILCVFCGLMNMFFSKFWDEWTTVSMFIFWFGCVFMDVLYNLNQNRRIKNTTTKTIQSMEKLSLLVQKSTHFVQECSNLHSSCFHTYGGKNPNAFKYLLMSELKTLLITVLQDLINNLVYNISEVHTCFPLKDSVSNIVYLYKTDCKIDLKDTSIENINKAKYIYFLLQSEFLKQSALCLCPALWTPHSCFHVNRLIETIGKIEETYSYSYNVLYDEYNVYSMFKNNTIEQSKQPVQCTNINSDLKLKIYTIRLFLQNMMVHVRFMEDSFENSSTCNIDDINSTLNVLLKDVSVFNELISTLQINILKRNNNQTDKSMIINDSIGVTDHIDTDTTNEPIKEICEDELFFGISEEPTEKIENTFCNEIIFDKSNNHNLMLELKVALKDKQEEWKQRECKLLEKHSQLNYLSDDDDDDECNETQVQYINKVRKVALDLPPNESFSMQLPDKSFASEIAMVACRRNTAIECFGDDSDSSISIDSNDS